MNLARGFKRVLVVATLVYWGVAGVAAYQAYRTDLDRAETLSAQFRNGTIDPDLKPLFAEGVRRGLLGTPSSDRRLALEAAGRQLVIPAAAYVGLAAALGALWWIIAGFRSPRTKPE